MFFNLLSSNEYGFLYVEMVEVVHTWKSCLCICMFQEMLEWDMGSYCDNSVVVPDNAISSSSNNCFYIIWLRLFNV